MPWSAWITPPPQAGAATADVVVAHSTGTAYGATQPSDDAAARSACWADSVNGTGSVDNAYGLIHVIADSSMNPPGTNMDAYLNTLVTTWNMDASVATGWPSISYVWRAELDQAVITFNDATDPDPTNYWPAAMDSLVLGVDYDYWPGDRATLLQWAGTTVTDLGWNDFAFAIEGGSVALSSPCTARFVTAHTPVAFEWPTYSTSNTIGSVSPAGLGVYSLISASMSTTWSSMKNDPSLTVVFGNTYLGSPGTPISVSSGYGGIGFQSESGGYLIGQMANGTIWPMPQVQLPNYRYWIPEPPNLAGGVDDSQVHFATPVIGAYTTGAF